MGKPPQHPVPKSPEWAMFHLKILSDPNLDGACLRVYGVLAYLCGPSGYWVNEHSQEELVKKTRLSLRSVKRSIQQLVKCGYVMTRRQHKRKYLVYCVAARYGLKTEKEGFPPPDGEGLYRWTEQQIKTGANGGTYPHSQVPKPAKSSNKDGTRLNTTHRSTHRSIKHTQAPKVPGHDHERSSLSGSSAAADSFARQNGHSKDRVLVGAKTGARMTFVNAAQSQGQRELDKVMAMTDEEMKAYAQREAVRQEE